METLMRVKDITLFNQWIEDIDYNNTMELEDLFNNYIVMNLIYFLFQIIVPIFLSLNTYLAYNRTGINKLFIFLWSIFILASFAYRFIELSYYSVFYYIILLSYIILFSSVVSLSKYTRNHHKGGE